MTTDDVTSADENDHYPETYEELNDQIEVVKELFEIMHGDALKYKQEQQASAFYSVIECLEDAQRGKFDPSKVGDWQNERSLESIEKSREAREKGYREATLLGHDRKQRNESRGIRALIERLLS